MKPRLTHVALRVKDLERSIAFYERYARLVVCHRREDDGVRVVWLAERPEDPAFVFVLLPMPHSEGERPGVHHLGFSLASRGEVDAVADAARRDDLLREGPRNAGPVVGYFCIVEDPDGNWVEFSFGQPINPRELPTMSPGAAFWIARLALRPHPEGGYFRETYRAGESIVQAALPTRYDGPRALATAIYFLLPSDEISALHRLRSDELWHFHAGSALELTTLDLAGDLRQVTLGPSFDDGETLQATIPAGVWFGAAVRPPGSFALVGCTVAPGFEFADFELAERDALLRAFPRHRATIERLTRAPSERV